MENKLNRKLPLYFKINNDNPLTNALIDAFNQMRTAEFNFKRDFERHPQEETIEHFIASATLQLHQLAEMIEYWEPGLIEYSLEYEKVKKQELQNAKAELQRKIHNLEEEIANLS